MNEEVKRVDGGMLVGGIILIALGILFLLSRLDVADFGQLVRRHWPMIIVIVGTVKLFARDTVWSGLWLVAVGAWLQVAHLQMFGLTYRTSWPLLLIALGGGLILRAFVESVMRGREEPHER